MSRILILDAMGVLYRAADDVAELLVPFVIANDGINDAQAIESVYMQASSGKMAAEEFWLRVGVDPRLEDEYLEGHCLSDGLLEFLWEARRLYSDILCLSNDVSEWSVKLRKKFGLDEFISRWFVSGDMRVRKPALEIYQQLVSATNLDPSGAIFVDDRPKNLLPAQSLGMSCVLFDPSGSQTRSEFPVARAFHDIIVASF